MGDIRFLAHVLLRRAARARLDQIRRPRGNDQKTPEGDVVRENHQGGSR